MDVLITDEGVENTPVEAVQINAQTLTVQEPLTKKTTTSVMHGDAIFNFLCSVFIIASLVLLFFSLKKHLDFVTLTCAISGMLFSGICLFLILTKPKKH